MVKLIQCHEELTLNVPFTNLTLQYQSIKPEIDGSIQKVVDSGKFILGEQVSRFEHEFAKYCGSKYAIGVANGTDAVKLGLIACGVKKGDEVVTVSNTAAPTVLAIIQIGAKPIFVDINPETYNIDVDKVNSAITNKTKAIVPVHLYGRPCEMSELTQYGVPIVDDACQGHGSEYKGKKIGSIGECTGFSFYPTKNLGCMGDGGMVTTNNPEIDTKLRMLRNYGMKKQYFSVIRGFNSRLDEIQSSILSVKLKYLDEWNDRRRKIARMYDELLRGVSTPQNPMDSKHVYHLYVIRHGDRDWLMEELKKHGISTMVHYPFPVHQQTVFSEYKRCELPFTEKFSKEILSLPIYPEMTDEQVEYVAKKVNQLAQPI